MGELAPVALVADRREDPLGRDVLPVGLGVAEVALVIADQLRLPIAVHVRERRRFIVHLVEDLMPRPVLLLPLRVQVEEGRRARQAVGEHVIPAVAVEVVDEREEVVRRVGVPAAQHALETGELHVRTVLLRLRRARGRINLVALREVRPFPPIRPGDGVGLPVLVQVAERRALGPVVLVELLLLERVQREVGGGGGEREGAKARENERKRLHAAGCRKRRRSGQAGIGVRAGGCSRHLQSSRSRPPAC